VTLNLLPCVGYIKYELDVDDNPNRVSALVHTELEVELLDSLILTTRCLVSTSLLDIVAINELAEVTANTSSTTLPSNTSTLDATYCVLFNPSTEGLITKAFSVVNVLDTPAIDVVKGVYFGTVIRLCLSVG
jgi:hypothetical protein